MPGHTVGGRYQFSVGQAVDRDCIRSAIGLSIDQFMDALIWYRRRCGIERFELCPFAGTRERYLLNRCVWLGHQPLQQDFEMPHHPLDGCSIEQLTRVLQFPAQPHRSIPQVERKVEDGGLFFLDDEVPRWGRIPGLLDLEHHLMERVATEIAFRLKIFDEFLEGQVLMSIRAYRSLSDPRQQFPKGGFTVQITSQDDRIDEKSDQAFQLTSGAARDR